MLAEVEHDLSLLIEPSFYPGETMWGTESKGGLLRHFPRNTGTEGSDERKAAWLC